MASAVLDDLQRFAQRAEPPSREEAEAYTHRLVRTQYENFSVLSSLLPKRLRRDFANVYAFCRWADDLGDETGDPERSLELLAWWRRELDACFAGAPRHPVFVALRGTVERHDLERAPFDHLIDAFEQDQRKTRYESWDEVLGYCRLSANPVGRLVLALCAHTDDERRRLSDATCTALQLANFWQDVRRDVLERGRIYIPGETARAHGLSLETLAQAIRADAGDPACGACADVESAGIRALRPAYRATLRELVDRTWPLFREGRGLWPLLEREIRPSIELFTRGGEAVLRRIERIDYDTMRVRPKIGKARKATLILGAALRRWL